MAGPLHTLSCTMWTVTVKSLIMFLVPNSKILRQQKTPIAGEHCTDALNTTV